MVAGHLRPRHIVRLLTTRAKRRLSRITWPVFGRYSVRRCLRFSTTRHTPCPLQPAQVI